jgi:hypothetical protein
MYPAPIATVLELVLHGDTPASHDHLVGRPGAFDALFTEAAEAMAAGVTVVVTVPLGRSTYRSLTGIPLLLRARGIAALRLEVPLLAENEHPTRVPRLALALPFALHALAVAKRLALPAFLSGAPLCLLGPYGGERIASAPRSYAPVCEGCPGRAACPGVDPRYREAFGDAELRALKAAPPPPAAHPLGTRFRG